MKKLAGVLTASLLVLTSAAAVSAAEGKIVDGRTLVPVRGVFEELGLDVDWNAETAVATISNSDYNIEISKGKTYFSVNGQTVEPDVPQQIIDSRFYLPLRAVGESIGADISWDSETKTAHISYNGSDSYVNCGKEAAEQPTEKVSLYGDYVSAMDITGFIRDYAGLSENCKGSINIYVVLNLAEDGTATIYLDSEATENSVKNFLKENLTVYAEEQLGVKLSGAQMDELAAAMGYSSLDDFIDSIADEMDLEDSLTINETGRFSVSGNKISLEGDEGEINNGSIMFDMEKIAPDVADEFETYIGTHIWTFTKR